MVSDMHLYTLCVYSICIIRYVAIKCHKSGYYHILLGNIYSKHSWLLILVPGLLTIPWQPTGVTFAITENQGILFRKYMADLSHYLHLEIIAHMLWADDLVLFSDTPKGLQRQLDGLKAFCANNQMLVNGMKTKFMCFGKKSDCKLSFDIQEITRVDHYKYVGNQSHWLPATKCHVLYV